MLAEALAQTGGDLTANERAWVDRILDTGSTASDQPHDRGITFDSGGLIALDPHLDVVIV